MTYHYKTLQLGSHTPHNATTKNPMAQVLSEWFWQPTSSGRDIHLLSIRLLSVVSGNSTNAKKILFATKKQTNKGLTKTSTKILNQLRVNSWYITVSWKLTWNIKRLQECVLLLDTVQHWSTCSHEELLPSRGFISALGIGISVWWSETEFLQL